MSKIFGFTLIRNGLKYDYPFRECFTSLAGICERIYVALGKSEDGTEAAVRSLAKIREIPTVWDENLRKSGLILSEQVNTALKTLRAEESTGWAFHLQADELIAEHEYEQIRRDFAQAEAEGCDAVSFRYLHFWQAFDRIAFAKRWYAHEVRAIRVDSAAESYGDAQGFRNYRKVFQSDAHIFHYGHVRAADAYERKKKDFHRWWHSDEEMRKIIAKGERNDKVEPSLPYLGPHPRAMADRILRSREKRPAILIYGKPEDYPERLRKGLLVEKQEWTMDFARLRSADPTTTVVLAPLSWLEHIMLGFRYVSRAPSSMLSLQARPWTAEFAAIMRLSAKGFTVDY